MRKRLFSLFGIVFAVVLLEFLTRGCINRSVNQTVTSRSGHIARVTTQSGDVPAVFYEGVLGRLQNGSITLHDIVSSRINVAQLTIAAPHLTLSRLSVFSGTAKIGGSPPYFVTAFLSPKNLSDSYGRPVTFRSTYAYVSMGDHFIQAQPKLVGRTVVVSNGKETAKFPLPSTDLLPCQPAGLGVGNGIVLACETSIMPKILADAVR